MALFLPNQWLIDAIVTISHQLHSIAKKIDYMAKTQADFDAQLSSFMDDLTAQTKKINDTVQAILDKNAAAGSPLDLTAESAQLSKAQDALDAISSNLPTTPTPAPAPAAPTVAAVPPPDAPAPTTEAGGVTTPTET